MTTHPATIVRSEDRRETAEVSDDGDVRPPQLYVLADEGEHGSVINAVAQTLGDEPNAVDGPSLTVREDDAFGALDFRFRPNELPVVQNGEVAGWLAPYRAEEHVREALRRHLPDGWDFETQRKGHLVLFEE